MRVSPAPQAVLLGLIAVAFASCSSGAPGFNPLPRAGNSGSLRPEAAATLVPSPLPSTIILQQGKTTGQPGAFTPPRGDTPSGGAGQSVDGISCLQYMVDNQFHVHSFVGILVNGMEPAIPDSIGMHGPGPLVNGFVNSAHCFYQIHTHDASGMVHQEAASTVTDSGSLFTLGNFLDIWGQTLTSSGFGPFTGIVQVDVARPPLRTLYVKNYAVYTGDPNQIPLYSHEVIWIQVGQPYRAANQLPTIRFYTEY